MSSWIPYVSNMSLLSCVGTRTPISIRTSLVPWWSWKRTMTRSWRNPRLRTTSSYAGTSGSTRNASHISTSPRPTKVSAFISGVELFNIFCVCWKQWNIWYGYVKYYKMNIWTCNMMDYFVSIWFLAIYQSINQSAVAIQWNPSGKARNVSLKLQYFGTFPCTILYKSCLFYHSWHVTSFEKWPSRVAFIEGFHCMLFWKASWFLQKADTMSYSLLYRDEVDAWGRVASTLPGRHAQTLVGCGPRDQDCWQYPWRSSWDIYFVCLVTWEK